jgi:hypothetical protein
MSQETVMTRREVRAYDVTPPNAEERAEMRALLERRALLVELEAAVNEIVAHTEATAHA